MIAYERLRILYTFILLFMITSTEVKENVTTQLTPNWSRNIVDILIYRGARERGIVDRTSIDPTEITLYACHSRRKNLRGDSLFSPFFFLSEEREAPRNGPAERPRIRKLPTSTVGGNCRRSLCVTGGFPTYLSLLPPPAT